MSLDEKMLGKNTVDTGCLFFSEKWRGGKILTVSFNICLLQYAS